MAVTHLIWCVCDEFGVQHRLVCVSVTRFTFHLQDSVFPGSQKSHKSTLADRTLRHTPSKSNHVYTIEFSVCVVCLPAVFLLQCSVDDGVNSDLVSPVLYTTSPTHTSPAQCTLDSKPTQHKHHVIQPLNTTWDARLMSVWFVFNTQVKPRQLIASASMSPNKDGHEFSAGKYACMWGLCQCTTYNKHTQHDFIYI